MRAWAAWLSLCSAPLGLSQACKDRDVAPDLQTTSRFAGEREPVTRLDKPSEFAGCAAVRVGPVCEITAEVRDLSFFVEYAAEEIRFGETKLESTGEPVGTGKVVRVRLPKQDPSLAKHQLLTLRDTATNAAFRLRVEEVEQDERIREVQRLRKAGRLEDAQAALPPLADFSATWRGRAMSLHARLALARGDTESAIRELGQAMAIHRAEGRASDEVLDGFLLAHTWVGQKHALSEARKVLAGLAEPLTTFAAGRAEFGYFRALIDIDAGDLREALRGAKDSERAASRLGLEIVRRSAQEVEAEVHERLGEYDAALAVRRDIEARLPSEVSPCEEARVLTNRVWSEILAATSNSDLAKRLELQARPPPESQVRGTQEAHIASERAQRGSTLHSSEVVATWERNCPRTDEVANARTNAALYALNTGNIKEASQQAKRVRESGRVPSDVAVWLLDIEGRIALLQADPRRALAKYQELKERGDLAGLPEVEWRALVGKATVLESLGHVDAARQAYESAEQLLNLQSLQVPMNDGRAAFLTGRDRSAKKLVDLLLRAQRPAQAFAAAREARVRALRSTQRFDRVSALSATARSQWEDLLSRYNHERAMFETDSQTAWSIPLDQLPARREAQRQRQERMDALLDQAFTHIASSQAGTGTQTTAPVAPPAPGELVAMYLESADAKQVHVFASDTHGLRTFDVPTAHLAPSDEVIAAQLLDPLATMLEGKRVLRIVTQGPLATIDFHALPFRGRPLLEQIRVEYGVDVAKLPMGDRDALALIVADTTDNLPHSRNEAQQVADALHPNWRTHKLEGAAARRKDVMDALSRSTWFHFAGHASFDAKRGWDSALHMAEGSELRTGDILALPRVPRTVILSGCETGRLAPAAVADMSLAHAFVVAGADLVIAASRPVEDRLAAALVQRTYRDARGQWDVAESFRAAQIEASQTMPASNWRAYRMIVP